MVLPVAVATGVTRQLLTTERSSATGNYCPPGFGLCGAQGVLTQIRWAKLAQRVGQGDHDQTARVTWALELGQASEQVQRINVFGGTKLWADQMQVPPGGADVTVTQQLLDGEEVNAAFKQVGGKAVAQGAGHRSS